MIPRDIMYKEGTERTTFLEDEPTELWSWAEKELKNSPLKEKISLYASIYHPEWIGNGLDSVLLSDKLDVLFKIPHVLDELSLYLTHRQIEILKSLSSGNTAKEVCAEFGYTNPSTVYANIKNIKDRIRKILEQQQTEEEIEEELIRRLNAS